jgi:hypothetical protein
MIISAPLYYDRLILFLFYLILFHRVSYLF